MSTTLLSTPAPSRPGTSRVPASTFRNRLISAVVFALVLLLGCAGGWAEYLDPDTGRPVGFSDLAALDGSTYVVVTDVKSHQAGRRLGRLTVPDAGPPQLEMLPLVEWGDPRGKASDLEGVCALPGHPGEFLVLESGSWQERPGRVFRLRIEDASATVLAFHDLPTLAPNDVGRTGDQYEGLACATRREEDDRVTAVLLILGERGGSVAHPSGRLRWAEYDLGQDAISWSDEGETGLAVTAPGSWLRPFAQRDVSALYLDATGTVWAAATEEGGDTGPFNSVVYSVARVEAGAPSPIAVIPDPAVTWQLAGRKIEGLAAPPRVWRYAWILAATEDEDLGGDVFALETVVPGQE